MRGIDNVAKPHKPRRLYRVGLQGCHVFVEVAPRSYRSQSAADAHIGEVGQVYETSGGRIKSELSFNSSVKQKSTDTFSQDLIGYNYFGMQFLQRQIENAEGVQLFRDATVERKKGEKKRKKRENLKRSIMVLNS